MKYEKSCGALIFKMIKNKLFVLLIKQTNREWGFPKGHVENIDATDFDTAIREVKEETNLDIKIFKNAPIYRITYYPYEGCIKEVYFFIAISTSYKIYKQKEEILKIKWVSINKAFDILSHKESKDVLKNAIKWFDENIINQIY